MQDIQSSDPAAHVRNVRQEFQDLRDHLRKDIQRIDEPQLKAVFETCAEVIGGIDKTLADYQRKNEEAWDARD